MPIVRTPCVALSIGLLSAAMPSAAQGSDLILQLERMRTMAELSVAPRLPAPKALEAPRETARDPFIETEACSVVDAHYLRRPTVREALELLKPCLADVRKSYGLDASALEGTAGIVLVVAGPIPPGNTLLRDLRHALRVRDGKLFGHPASLVPLDPPDLEKRVSSLQLVVDRCPTIMVLRKIATGADFLDAYGDCLLKSKGLDITDVMPDPEHRRGVVVYSRESVRKIFEMNGMITVPAEDGPARIRVRAKRELLSNKLIEVFREVPGAVSFP